MVAPDRRSRVLLTPEKEQSIETFTDICNTVCDNEKITKDFESKYTEWFNTFSSEYKSIKSQAILYMQLPCFLRILFTAVLVICVLEAITELDISYAFLGCGCYFTLVAYNFVSNIVIKYYSSQDGYVSQVNQYFESVLSMFHLFKTRLDVLRMRCNWAIKSSSVLNIESKYTNENISYANLFFSALHLHNMKGIAVGFMTFLVCQYFEFHILPVLKIFTYILCFVVAFVKTVKIHRFREKLKAGIKCMKKVTTDFLTWFENNCELCKILQKHQSLDCVTDLFPLISLKICRKHRLLNFAFGVTACAVFAGLKITRNDFKSALLFVVHGIYSLLFELTAKKINTQVSKKLSNENTVKKRYRSSRTNAFSHDLDRTKEHPDSTATNQSKGEKAATKTITIKSTSRDYFVNENSKISCAYINRKSSYFSQNKANAISESKSFNQFGAIGKDKNSNKSAKVVSKSFISDDAKKYENTFGYTQNRTVHAEKNETLKSQSDVNIRSGCELKDIDNILNSSSNAPVSIDYDSYLYESASFSNGFSGDLDHLDDLSEIIYYPKDLENHTADSAEKERYDASCSNDLSEDFSSKALSEETYWTKDLSNATAENAEKERFDALCSNDLSEDLNPSNALSEEAYWAKDISNAIAENAEKERFAGSCSNVLSEGLNNSNALSKDTYWAKGLPNATAEKAEKERFDASCSNDLSEDLNHSNALSEEAYWAKDISNATAENAEKEIFLASCSNGLSEGLNNSNALSEETYWAKDLPNATEEREEKERYDASCSNDLSEDFLSKALSEETYWTKDLPNVTAENAEKERFDALCSNDLSEDLNHSTALSGEAYWAKGISNAIAENAEKERFAASCSNGLSEDLNNSNALSEDMYWAKGLPNAIEENAKKERFDALCSNDLSEDLNHSNALSVKTDWPKHLPNHTGNQSVVDIGSEYKFDELDILDFSSYEEEMSLTYLDCNSAMADWSSAGLSKVTFDETDTLRKKETHIEENEKSNNELRTTRTYVYRCANF